MRALGIGLALCAMALGIAMAEPAKADVPIYSFNTGASSSQAGGHPDIVVGISFGTSYSEPGSPCRCNTVKDIVVNMPAGVLGAPRDIPQCTAVEFAASSCPIDSQVGVVLVQVFTPLGDKYWQPLYNMVPRPDQLALLATPAPLAGADWAVYTVVSARTESDYGLEFTTTGLSKLFPPSGITQITWGVPADPVHDPIRFPFDHSKSAGRCPGGDQDPLPELLANQYPAEDCPGGAIGTAPFAPVSANSPAVPFLSNPTVCAGPSAATLDISAYDLTANHAEATYPAITGCDQLGFDPSLAAKPTTTEADAPSGLDIDLAVPQTLSATTPSPSQIRATTVKLPLGFTVNPNAADGKSSCADTEARFGTRERAQCPEFSKIGTLEIESSSLPGILPGAVYLGKPLPGDRYRVFLTADGFSLHVKLAGTAKPDPLTGQLSVTFPDLPQAPFQRFNLHIFGAERGLLATPAHCGTYAVKSTFVPWATGVPNQTSTQFFEVDSGPGGSPCPPDRRPFAPGMSAGVTDNTGGAHTDFVFDLTRKDGDQNLTAVEVANPPGFTGRLTGIPYCPEAAISAAANPLYTGLAELSAPACPAASRLGTARATVGAGTRPLTLPGTVYLAGPYKGAPLSFAVITPAVSGPYDLGNVVVRVALHVDPTDAHITALSDSLPQIVEGIPLRLRRIVVELDREDFVLNPTNCLPFAVGAEVSGDQGAAAELSTHFQVANCGALDFAPKLGLQLRGSTKRRGHPALRAVLRAKPGESNIGVAIVAMPKTQLLDNANIGTACTRVQFAADACPAGSLIGRAMAQTPLLDQPLQGPVYLRSSDNKLPDLVVALRGQIEVELAGRIDTTKAGGLRTTFETVPDAPVSKFVLNLKGGPKGLLVNSEDLCRSPQRATVKLIGQNGRQINRRTKLQTSCSKRRAKRSKHRSGSGKADRR